MINNPVSVSLNYDSKTQRVCPSEIIWHGREYQITKLGLHHTFCEGRTLYHVFSVAAGTLFFRLVLNSETLHWKLEQVGDELIA
jgi:hypothetical protein